MPAVLKTVAFYGTAPARSGVTLLSKRISTSFRLRGLVVTFPVGTLNLLTLRFYASLDQEVPTTTEPSGVSLLRDYGQVDYLAGDGEQLAIDHSVDMAEAGSYLKVWALNTDFYDHAVNVQMTLEIPD
jgi:hypothetical protein